MVELFEQGGGRVYFDEHLRHDATGEQVGVAGLKLYSCARGERSCRM